MEYQNMRHTPFTKEERDLLLAVAEFFQNSDRDELQRQCDAAKFIQEERFYMDGERNSCRYLLAHYNTIEQMKISDCDYGRELREYGSERPMEFRSSNYTHRVLPLGYGLDQHAFGARYGSDWKKIAARLRMFAAWKYSIDLLDKKLDDAFSDVEITDTEIISSHKSPEETAEICEKFYAKYYKN